MSGNITPDRLLSTLKLLLSTAGGIRSREEVCKITLTGNGSKDIFLRYTAVFT